MGWGWGWGWGRYAWGDGRAECFYNCMFLWRDPKPACSPLLNVDCNFNA